VTRPLTSLARNLLTQSLPQRRQGGSGGASRQAGRAVAISRIQAPSRNAFKLPAGTQMKITVVNERAQRTQAPRRQQQQRQARSRQQQQRSRGTPAIRLL